MANTKRNKRRSRKNKIFNKILYLILFVLVLLVSIFMIKSLLLLKGIETKIRYLFIVDLGLIVLFYLFLTVKSLENSKKKHILYVLFGISYSIVLFIGSSYIKKAYKMIDKISTDSTMYYSSLITLKDNKVDKISDIKDGTLGYLSDTESIEGNQLPKEIIKEKKLKNKVKEYDDYVIMLQDLLDEKIEYIFVPENYALRFSSLDEESFKDLDKETKVLFTKDKKIEEKKANETSDLNEPFTVLIMGVDSEKENIKGSSFNGDALMLLTFNPKTLNTTILSIPRDSYVPIACFKNKEKNKITHAAVYGADCMINTISDFLDVKIDYYLKINFKGVVKIIDSLGGVEVDVPYSFCEQDSNRHFGKNTIYVKKGLQTLNGEQALALSRNRKSNSGKCSKEWTKGVRNDFVRGQNQQLVLRALLNKIKGIDSLDTITSLMESVSNSMETNMKTDEILSLYNIAKDILVQSNNSKVEDLLGFTRLYLSGYDKYIYDERTKLNLYNYVLYNDSVKAVKNAMKTNLGLMSAENVKTFAFDINEEYEEIIIGKNVK